MIILFLPSVSQNQILNKSWSIACPLADRSKIYIYCDTQKGLEIALELSPAIAREFPLIKELVFFVADKKWITVPTDQVR